MTDAPSEKQELPAKQQVAAQSEGQAAAKTAEKLEEPQKDAGAPTRASSAARAANKKEQKVEPSDKPIK